MAVGGLKTKGGAIQLPQSGAIYIPGGATPFWIASFVRFPSSWPAAGQYEDFLTFSGNISSGGGNDRLIRLRPSDGNTNNASTYWHASRSGAAMIASSDRAQEFTEERLKYNESALVIFGRQIEPEVRTFRIVCPVGGTPEVFYDDPSADLGGDWAFDILGSSNPSDDYAFERLGLVLGEFAANQGELDLSIAQGLATGAYKGYDDENVINGGTLQRYIGLTTTDDNTEQTTQTEIDMTGVVNKPMIAPWSPIQITTKTRVVPVSGLGATT